MEKKMKFCWWQPKVNIKYKIVGKEGMAEKIVIGGGKDSGSHTR